MNFIKSVYYRLRRIKKAMRNWKKFGVIIFGSIFLLANLIPASQLADAATPKLTYLYTNPATLSIEEGKSYQFHYIAEDQNHNPITVTPSWTMAKIAAGSITQDGVFTASNSIGTYTNAVKLSAGGLVTFAKIVISESDSGNEDPDIGDPVIGPDPTPAPKLTYLYTNPATLSIEEGNNYQFHYIAEDQNHNPIPVNASWSMAKPAAGSITQDGVFTASNGIGTHTNAIKLSAGGLVTFAKIIVTEGEEVIPPPTPKLTYLYTNPATLSIEEGNNYQFHHIAEDQNHNPILVNASWSMAKPAAGSITQSGVFTASNNIGTYTNAIKLSAGGLVTFAKIIITEKVEEPRLNSVQVSPASTSLYFGEQGQFIASAYDQFGNKLNDVNFSWSLTDNSIGSIGSNGLFTADNKAGNFTGVVRLKGTRDGINKYAYASIEVLAKEQPPVTTVLSSLVLTPSYSELDKGVGKQFSATAYDQNGNVLNNLTSFYWEVVNGGGSINQIGYFNAGNVDGTFSNTVKVTASYDGINLTDFATVVVLPGTITTSYLVSVGLVPSSINLDRYGNYQFQAVAYDQNGNVINSTTTFYWEVINGGGSINQTGYFTAGSATGTFGNTVKVTASRAGITKTDTATVTVSGVTTQNVIDRVEISPTSVTLRIGYYYDFNAQAYDVNGNALTSGVSYDWSVITGPGTINQNGYFTAGNYEGTATVQVRATHGNISKYALATVYVDDNDDPNYGDEIRYVRITPSVAYLSPGQAIDFDAQAYNYRGQAISASYIWELNRTIGHIDQNGYFRASSNAYTGTYSNAVKVRAYSGGRERVDYADVIISGGGNNDYNYSLSASLNATDDNGGSVEEGDVITYKLDINNFRNRAVTNVNITFDIPEYTRFVSVTSTDGTPTVAGNSVRYNVGFIHSGYSKHLTVKVRVDSSVPSDAVVRGKALVWASEINSFWVYANDLYVNGGGYYTPGYTDPLVPTGGAMDWIFASLIGLMATLITRRFIPSLN
ncbi:MAG: hypothetical protein U9M89_02650 [Patescibacteria group bacterium]|nr:hypothetical protein [Patescibacteria group bacterium]